MDDYNEKKNKRTGAIVSGAVHLVILILFIFMLAWREPNPPLPEYGIELNFGTSDIGSGDIQPLNTPTDQSEIEPTSEENEVVEESETNPTENTEQLDKPIEESSETQEEITVIEDENSPDLVEEEQKEVKEEIKEEEIKNEKEITNQTENVKEEITNDSESTSHGDNTNKVGDLEYSGSFSGSYLSGGGSDDLCSPKALGDLSDAKGICPEAPALEGTYDVAGLAYHAKTEDYENFKYHFSSTLSRNRYPGMHQG